MTDTALDLAAVHKVLSDHDITVTGEVRASLITGGRSNLTYLIYDDEKRWILRRPPTAGLTPSAHDVAREFRVTSALSATGIPVARTVAMCEDATAMGAPFTLVEYVDGNVIRTREDLDRLDDAEVAACVAELLRVLGQLHTVDYRAVGLEEFGRPDGYVSRQVARWASQWAKVKIGKSTDVDLLVARLLARIPASSANAIVHGDYRIDNTMLDIADPGLVRAVVDWELSTLGDPVTDLAMMCVYRNPAFDLLVGEPAAWTSERLPGSEELAERYSRMSGRDLGDWGFYLGLANLKIAVIAAGIDHRFRAGASLGAGFESAGLAVDEFVSAGLAALR